MKRFLQVFYPIFSAILLSYAIPNEISLKGSIFAGAIALIPLYIALSHSHSYRESFGIMGLQAFATHIFSSFWLANFKDFAALTLGASAVGTAAIAAAFGLLMYIPYSENVKIISLNENGGQKIYQLPLRIFWFTAVFTCWEWVKSNGFLGYPWGTVSMSVIKSPILMQISDITGTYGITFIFALLSAIIGEGINLIPEISHFQAPKTISTTYLHTSSVCCAFMILSFCYGLIEYFLPRHPTKHLNAVLVQQNCDPWINESDAANIELSEKLSEDKINKFKEEDKKTDLVVWSEGVLRYTLPTSYNHYTRVPESESLIGFIKRMKIPFIIGGCHTINRDKQEYTNSAILFDENGNYKGQYGKIHLVPFAEIIPGGDLEWVQRTMQRLVGFSSGWTAGKDITLFKIPCSRNPETLNLTPHVISAKPSHIRITPNNENDTTVLISTPICFEDAFADMCGLLYKAGCEVFLNITDDSWSLTKSAEYQHFAAAVFRAIEYRTTLVRSTNAGYSVVVNPAGKIIADMPLFKADSLAVTIPIYNRHTTVYAKLGNWLPKILLLLIFIFCGRIWYIRKYTPEEKIKKPFFMKNKKKSN